MKRMRLKTCFYIAGLLLAVAGLTGSQVCLAENPNVTAGKKIINSTSDHSDKEENDPESSVYQRDSTTNETIHRLQVPAASFSSDGSEPDSSYYSFSGGYIAGTSTGDGCIKTGVDIPNDVKIKYFWVTYYDNDASRSMTVQLWKTNRVNGTTTGVASATSSVAGASTNVDQMQSTSPINEFTSSTYSYSLTTCLPNADFRLYSVRVYHTLQGETHFNKLIIDSGYGPAD